MNFNKSIVYLFLILCSFAANIEARSFEVFVKEGLQTLDGQPATEYQVINIEGQYPDAVDNPTYGQIRKGIAQAFSLDPHWRNFTIKYTDVNTGKVYFLKPHLEGLSRKERTAFFDKLAQSGFMNMPTLIIAKREPSTIPHQPTGISLEEFEIQQPGIGAPEEEVSMLPYTEPYTTGQGQTFAQEEPDWVFEETLVGESDPYLIEQLKAAKQKYE
jgi:hypothetical protein